MMSFHCGCLVDLWVLAFARAKRENEAKPAQRIAFDLRRNRDEGLSPKSCLFETQPAQGRQSAGLICSDFTAEVAECAEADPEKTPIRSYTKDAKATKIDPRQTTRFIRVLFARSAVKNISLRVLCDLGVKISGLGEGAKDGFQASSLESDLAEVFPFGFETAGCY
jgi:hypothetical protein